MSKNVDIADTYVVIRDVNRPQKALYTKTLPYFQRSVDINIVGEKLDEIKAGVDDYEICVLARNSKAIVRGFYKRQCRNIPANLASSAGVHRRFVILYIVVLSIVLGGNCR